MNETATKLETRLYDALENLLCQLYADGMSASGERRANGALGEYSRRYGQRHDGKSCEGGKRKFENACPSCDSTNIENTSRRGKWSRLPEDCQDWYCYACGNSFRVKDGVVISSLGEKA